MMRTYLPAGFGRQGGWDLVVTPEDAGWTYSGLRVLSLAEGESIVIDTGTEEMIMVPLEGSFDVQVAEDGRWRLNGRRGVFQGSTDVLYLPIAVHATVVATSVGRVALPSARAEKKYPVQRVAADRIPVFVRGSGPWSRLVRDFGNREIIEADRLIAVEVVNPGGNWSGLPRHKHDTPSGAESQLEEIYYFEAADTPNGAGYGVMRVSSSEAGAIDVLEEVRSGDVVLVPHGWHGPVAALPGNDLYYLNVMAGATGRSWNITNNPEDDWIVRRWADLEPDPRIAAEQSPVREDGGS